MDHALQSLLHELGLSAVESQVYMANLIVGNASASAIARQAGMHRITTYETLKRLTAKGYSKMTIGQRKAKHFEPMDMKALREELEARRKGLESMLQNLNDLQPFFDSLRLGMRDQPEVSYFQGPEGVRTVFMDTLRHGRNEILNFATGDWYQSGFGKDFLEKYFTLRVQKRIPTRGVMPDTPAARSFFTDESNRRELRQIKYVPAQNYIFKHDISIYGDRVAIFSLQPGHQNGIIIRSSGIAQSFRSIFELLWHSLP